MYDVIIIGAGITGSMLAKDLSQYKLKVALLEKENDIADGATMANSAIVHTGYDPEEGTLKALLNVEGANKYEQLCKDLGCHYKTVGAFIAACGEEEEKKLDVLATRADERNIPYTWMSGEEARSQEEHLSDNVTKAINFYTTAVIYPWEVAIGCVEVAITNGVELKLNHPVTSIETKEDHYIVHSNNESYETKYVINCAGIFADKINEMVNEPTFKMNPRKGEYYVLDNDVEFVKHIIFPVPSEKGKGVLAVPTVFGNTLLGPNAEESEDTGTSSTGLQYVKDNVTKTMKDVPFNKVIRTFAGLRPSSSSKDFIIEETREHFINVASIESPGLASAPGISRYVVDMIKEKMPLEDNSEAIHTRKKPVVMADLSKEERDAMIKENSLYAKIICRCESISEAEIINCIHSPAGARTVKGVKKRVRPGMGKCQGGFCEPRVIQILARELDVSPMDIVLDQVDSVILEGENR